MKNHLKKQKLSKLLSRFSNNPVNTEFPKAVNLLNQIGSVKVGKQHIHCGTEIWKNIAQQDADLMTKIAKIVEKHPKEARTLASKCKASYNKLSNVHFNGLYVVKGKHLQQLTAKQAIKLL